MVALGNSTKSGNVIFAKTATGPWESQPLCLFEAKDYPTRSCYHAPTYPFPRWAAPIKFWAQSLTGYGGFEHGMNEVGRSHWK